MLVSAPPRFSTVVRRSILALLLLTPVVVFGQQPNGRPKPSGPNKPEPARKTEVVHGRRTAAREVLFEFRGKYLNQADERQINSILAELRLDADADEFEMLSDSRPAAAALTKQERGGTPEAPFEAL